MSNVQIRGLMKVHKQNRRAANEPATENGKVKTGTRTDTFMKAANMPVHVPLSGRTMAFDGAGKCVSGC